MHIIDTHFEFLDVMSRVPIVSVLPILEPRGCVA
jgi:hypothetical protein